MHVCVIGAGVVGVTTAWQMARRGWEVTLVDGGAVPASEASHGNGGQLSYNYVAPLAEPGVLPQLPVYLFSKTSPLRFRPRLDPAQWSWCLQFLQACTQRRSAETTAQLLNLAHLSRLTLESLLRETPISFGHLRNGKLVVYRSLKLLEKARAQVAYQVSLGTEQKVLNAEECVALEPALAPVRHKLAGAVYTPGEESGDCLKFTQGLFDHLAALPTVRIRMQTSVTRLEHRQGRIQGAITQAGERIEADHYVVAAGMGSRRLLLPLQTRLPIYALKGYSLSLPCAGNEAPAISVTDYERKTVYANLDGTLRIAAMVGIGVTGDQVEEDRIALVRRQARELLPQIDMDHAQTWAGHRPATPHGRPIIGRSQRMANLWLNAGHGALGFTLACGSSTLLGNLMAGEAPAIDATAFQPR